MKLIEKIKKIDDKKLEEFTIKSSNLLMFICITLVILGFITHIIKVIVS